MKEGAVAMSDGLERIDIALASDAGYFCGLYVTACSIARYASKNCKLRFHVLDAGVKETDKTTVERNILRFHEDVNFEWIPVSPEMFEGLPKWNGGYMVYTRLLLPRLLPCVDWCIYCDCDFTWMADVAELWRERDDQFAILSTADGTKYTLDVEEEWFKSHNFDIDREKYFCAGLTFFNLRCFRETKLDQRCLELLQLHPPFNDQSVLNITCLGKTKLVNAKWQRFTEVITQEDLDFGCVVHHAGEVPWSKIKSIQAFSDTRLIWHRMNACLNNMTMMQSVRRFFSLWYYIRYRAIAYVFRTPILSWAIKCIACLCGCTGAYAYQMTRARRLCIHE